MCPQTSGQASPTGVDRLFLERTRVLGVSGSVAIKSLLLLFRDAILRQKKAQQYSYIPIKWHLQLQAVGRIWLMGSH